MTLPARRRCSAGLLVERDGACRRVVARAVDGLDRERVRRLGAIRDPSVDVERDPMRSTSSRPRSSSTLIAYDHSVKPVARPATCGYFSCTSTSTPARWSASALVRPPTPPPATTTRPSSAISPVVAASRDRHKRPRHPPSPPGQRPDFRRSRVRDCRRGGVGSAFSSGISSERRRSSSCLRSDLDSGSRSESSFRI